MDDVPPPRAGTDTSDPDALPDAADATMPPVAWADPRVPSVQPPEPVILDVGDAFGRVLRTYAQGWRVFLALAVPYAMTAAAGSAVLAVTLLSGAFIPAIAYFLVVLSVGMIASVAMIYATSDLRAGDIPSVSSSARRAVARGLPALGSALAIVAVVIGLMFAISVVWVTLWTNPGGSDLVGLSVLVGLVLVVVVTIRWALVPAAVSVGRFGPIESLSESRRLTRKNAWRIFGLLFAIGLLSSPLSIGISLISRYADPVPTAIAVFIATVITGPLLSIAIATAYEDLAGQLSTESNEQPAGRRRGILVGALLGAGAVVLTVGVVLASQGGGRQLIAPDAGVILAGTGQNPMNPCRPENIKSTFALGEPIYIGGYFSQSAASDETLSVAIYVDEILVIHDAVATNPDGISCYYERAPIEGAAAGVYRIQVLSGTDTVADGRFTIR